ncbi:MAG: hypothetical protein KME65_07710 [Candidatus Thiodiazotropha sp. (ex Ctena orbiculata)]|uniref:Tellurite resistance protein TerB n=1 Tax=Candidatus Thiodiazotropha taylori TaxID=2792791 RepID=A0A944M8P7_9GAMM|nr:hypothetical protein [Candidatus Thiodiazotropha taylori]
MDDIEFKRLLFKVAFCSMACDGHIDDREVGEMRAMDKNTSYFDAIDLSDELSELVEELHSKGVKVIEELFDVLGSHDLNPIQELLVLEVALRIIYSDERHDENELRFIHLLRSKLKLHDSLIHDRFGDLDVLHVNQYTTSVDVPNVERQFLEELALPEFSDIEAIDIKGLAERGNASTDKY